MSGTPEPSDPFEEIADMRAEETLGAGDPGAEALQSYFSAAVLESESGEEDGASPPVPPGISEYYLPSKAKLCEDAILNVKGGEMEYNPDLDQAVLKKTTLDCGPGACPEALLRIAEGYIDTRARMELLMGKTCVTFQKRLEMTNFPLHAVILSGLGRRTVKNMKVHLKDIKGFSTCPCDSRKATTIRNFVMMPGTPLQKIKAGYFLGIKEPAFSFLTPVVPQDLGVFEDGGAAAAAAPSPEETTSAAPAPSPEEFYIGNLEQEDLIVAVNDPLLERALGSLKWPQVMHAIEALQDRLSAAAHVA